MAHILHKGSYWIGMAAAIAILLLPVFMGGKSSSGGKAIANQPPHARSPSWRPVLAAVLTCLVSMLILIAMGTFR